MKSTLTLALQLYIHNLSMQLEIIQVAISFVNLKAFTNSAWTKQTTNNPSLKTQIPLTLLDEVKKQETLSKLLKQIALTTLEKKKSVE